MAEAKFLEKKLASLLAANGPKVDASTLSRLVEFIVLMDKWNHVYNLTSVRNPEDMLLKHRLLLYTTLSETEESLRCMGRLYNIVP